MKTFDWKSLLQQNPLFSDLGEEEVAKLLDDEVSEENEYAQDSIIIKQGELADSMFLIGSGSVDIVIVVDDINRS